MSIAELLRTQEVVNAFSKTYRDESSPICLGLKNLEINLGNELSLTPNYSINGLCIGVNVRGANNATFYIPKDFNTKLFKKYNLRIRGLFEVYFEPKLGSIGVRATNKYITEMTLA